MNVTEKRSGLGGFSELKQRLWFLFLAIVIFRIGAHVPVPGLDPVKLAQLFQLQQGGLFGLFNMFSGGALSRFTVFALGVMPYISASIILQLLTLVSPQLAHLRKEGEAGQRQINEYTRYATVFLAAFQAVGISKMLASQGIVFNTGLAFYVVATLTLVAGTLFLMWLGEQATERGVGNGISMIIFAGIVAGLPSAVGKTFDQVRQGQMSPLTFLLVAAVVVAVCGIVVFIERGLRKIPVHLATRMQGRRLMPAQQTALPLKLNMAGVIPPIFASSIILFPASLAQWFGNGDGVSWLSRLGRVLQDGPVHFILFGAAILFFSFFYTALVFNPKETADNLKKAGALVPGIRPGDQTASYIDQVLTRLTLFGGLYVMAICLLPRLIVYAWNVPFYFGGTSLLIIIGVLMDFMSQIQAHMMAHQYEALMKQTNLKGQWSKVKI